MLRFGTLVFFILCAATSSWAGTICGTVRDSQSHAPLAGALVLLFNDHNQYTGQFDVTDQNGSYCITDVPIGTYTVMVRVDGFDAGGVGGVTVDTGTGVDIEATPPFHLADPFPNPASREVTFRMTTPDVDNVTLEVFDVQGRLVKEWRGVVSRDRAVHWDLRDSRGARIASGVYLVRLRAAGTQAVKRMVCVR